MSDDWPERFRRAEAANAEVIRRVQERQRRERGEVDLPIPPRGSPRTLTAREVARRRRLIEEGRAAGRRNIDIAAEIGINEKSLRYFILRYMKGNPNE